VRVCGVLEKRCACLWIDQNKTKPLCAREVTVTAA